MKVPTEQLRSLLGLTSVNYLMGHHPLAIVDTALALGGGMTGEATGATGASASVTAGQANMINIDNFSFGPATATVPAGTTVTWTNHDDIPHNVISTEKAFASPVLDTDQKFSFTFEKAGTYPYYCSIHPKMTGKVVVG